MSARSNRSPGRAGARGGTVRRVAGTVTLAVAAVALTAAPGTGRSGSASGGAESAEPGSARVTPAPAVGDDAAPTAQRLESRFAVGEPFPELLLPRLDDGSQASLAAFRGDKVILHVFASW